MRFRFEIVSIRLTAAVIKRLTLVRLRVVEVLLDDGTTRADLFRLFARGQLAPFFARLLRFKIVAVGLASAVHECFTFVAVGIVEVLFNKRFTRADFLWFVTFWIFSSERKSEAKANNYQRALHFFPLYNVFYTRT